MSSALVSGGWLMERKGVAHAPIGNSEGARLFEEVIAVCSGKDTAAERLGFREFAIHRRNPTI